MPDNYVIWILGVLSFSVGGLATTMFRWRREIDKDRMEDRVAITKLEAMQKEVNRNTQDIRDLTTRVTDGRTKRLYEQYKSEMDDTDD